MKALVTGANGHLGANLVRALLDRGDDVRVLVRREAESLNGLAIEQVRGDVTKPDTLPPAMEGIDVVFHMAAFISIDGGHGGQVERVNVGGARHVAEAALVAGVRRMIHGSSVHAFEQAPLAEPIDENRRRISGPGHLAYDMSKADGERAVLEVANRGLDVVIINPTGILGPVDFGPSRTGRLLLDLRARRLPALVDGGFDWVDVRDVAAGAIAAAERGRAGENYLLSGRWCTLHQLAEMAAGVTGVTSPRLVTPMWLARLGVPFASAYGRLRGQPAMLTNESLAALRSNPRVLSTRAARELGYSPRPLVDTVADLYDWFAGAGRASTGARAAAS